MACLFKIDHGSTVLSWESTVHLEDCFRRSALDRIRPQKRPVGVHIQVLLTFRAPICGFAFLDDTAFPSRRTGRCRVTIALPKDAD
jgi:hypothetical protein